MLGAIAKIAGKTALKKGAKKGFLKNLGKDALKQYAINKALNMFDSDDSESPETSSQNTSNGFETKQTLNKALKKQAKKPDYSDKVTSKKKFGPYEKIEDLLKEDRKNKDIKSRISNMLYTTSQYIGGYSDKDLKKLKVKPPKELPSTKDMKSLERSVNRLQNKLSITNTQPITAITEETGKKIVESNKKIIELLSHISEDLVDEQKTEIDQSFRNKEVQQFQTQNVPVQAKTNDEKGGLISALGGLLLASMAATDSGNMLTGLAGLGALTFGPKIFRAGKKVADILKPKGQKVEGTRIFDSKAKDAKAKDAVFDGEKTKASEAIENKTSKVKSAKGALRSGLKAAKKLPGVGTILTAIDTGLEIYDIESEASGKSQAEKDEIRGKGYTKLAGVSSAMAAGAVVGQALIPIPLVGAALGATVGALGGDKLMESDLGKKAQDLGVKAFKYSSDNDIMEDLDNQGIIDYNRIGSSKILDKQALMKLDKDAIKKLIDFDDFEGEDLEYLKYVYNVKLGKIEAFDIKKADEYFSNLEKRNSELDDFMQKVYEKTMDTDVLYAWSKIKGLNPEKVLNSKELELIEKSDPRIAELIRKHAITEMHIRAQAKSKLGMSDEDIDRKYHIGKFSQAYIKDARKINVADALKKMVPVLGPIASVYDMVTPEQQTLSHIAEYDNDDNALLDKITKQYETELPDSKRFSGDVKLVSGGALSASGSKCQGPYAKPNAPRGIRNNNPGNIRISTESWLGKIDPIYNTDGSFEQFTFPEFGIRALAVNLKNYQIKHRLYTVRGMITRFAPSNENNTNSYVNIVAKSLGISADTPIDFANPDVSLKLVKAIIKHENGVNPYPDNLIIRAINAALGLQDLTVNEVQSVTKYDSSESSIDQKIPDVSEVPNAQNVKQEDIDLGNAGNVDQYLEKSKSADTDHLSEEFKARLAQASKAYYEKFHQKLPVNTGYRNSHKQAELYLRKALGDPELRYDCAHPSNDESFPIGSTLNGFRVDPSRLRHMNGISVQGNNIIVHGSGKVNAHGHGLAIDVPSAKAAKFEGISRQFGLFRPIGSDPVHFQMFKGGKVIGETNPEVYAKNETETKVQEKVENVENIKTQSTSIEPPKQQYAESVVNNTPIFMQNGEQIKDQTKESILTLGVPPDLNELLKVNS